MTPKTTFADLILAIFLNHALYVQTAFANNQVEPSVKKSPSGICHDNTSPSYNRTKKFKAFNSIATCIEDGGRLPKFKTKQTDKVTEEAIEQGRGFVGIYDRSDWPHWLYSDKDCQNTRHEVLINISARPVSFNSDKECNVLDGE